MNSLALGSPEHPLGEVLVDVEALEALVVVGDDEDVGVLDHVDVGRDGDRLLVDLGEVARRHALELLDLLDGLVDLFQRDLERLGDRREVPPLDVVEVVLDDRHLHGVEAEHLALDAQALREVARGDAHRIEALDHRQHLGRVLGVEAGLDRQVLDGEVGDLLPVRALAADEIEVALLVEVTEDQLGEAALVVDEVAHLQLPLEVVVQVGGLGQVLLDRRHLLEAAAVRRQRLLELAVLEELLPVDLLGALLVGARVHVGGAIAALHALEPLLVQKPRTGRASRRSRAPWDRSRRRRAPGCRRAPSGPRPPARAATAAASGSPARAAASSQAAATA